VATTQQHLDVLSALDTAFLLQEGPRAQMHLGGIAIFEGPPPSFEEVVEHIRSRLDRVPRYRQKVVFPPGGIGRPHWIDDPTFHIGYHVRHEALPSPGGDAELRRVLARHFSHRLDRAKPLWEVIVVEGLRGDRFAVISKTHNAVVDGYAGVDIMSALFDLERSPAPDPAGGPWVPRPEPSAAELAAATWSGGVRDALALPARALTALAPSRVRRLVDGAGEATLAVLRPAPPSPLNVRIGPHRRAWLASVPLDDLKRVKNAFGGTVNDVVLAIVAGSLRRWLHARGLKTEGTELRAGVPVSTRAASDEGAMGNRIAQLVAPMPVDLADPVARLIAIQEAMRAAVGGRQAVGAESIAGAGDFAPPTILAQSGRQNFSTRPYNLRVTNIPGPQVPLYLLGRELEQVYPISFLTGDRALAVAVMSYNGNANIGLIADYDQVADLEVIADGLTESLAELVTLAVRREKRGRPVKAR